MLQEESRPTSVEGCIFTSEEIWRSGNGQRLRLSLVRVTFFPFAVTISSLGRFDGDCGSDTLRSLTRSGARAVETSERAGWQVRKYALSNFGAQPSEGAAMQFSRRSRGL